MEISSSNITKLAHNIPEIRIRALKHIEGRLNRALPRNENIEFNSGFLLKQLIRWFGQQPLCEEECVLNLMLNLMKSKYAGEIIRYLGYGRLKKELNKIYELLGSNLDCRNKITKIMSIVNDFEDPNNLDYAASINFPDDKTTTIDLCSDFSSTECLFESDSEEPWSKPSTADYTSLKLLCDSLNLSDQKENLQHAYKYLLAGIDDYPAEFFLQPPYIFKNLFNLFSKSNDDFDCVSEILLRLTKAIKSRLCSRHLAKTYVYVNAVQRLKEPKSQVTISHFCAELFKLLLQHLKSSTEIAAQIETNVLKLLFQLASLMERDYSGQYDSKLFLVELGYTIKYFRQNSSSSATASNFNRIYYLILLKLMGVLLQIFNDKMDGAFTDVSNDIKSGTDRNKLISAPPLYDDTKNFTFQKEIWQLELETVFYDFSIKFFYPKQYEETKKALKVDGSDCYRNLKLLLNFEEYLRPAVSFLRQPDDLSNEKLIEISPRLMESLCIHTSTDFVIRLLHAISNCLYLFDSSQRIKVTSEQLMLQLLSHDDIQIKRLVYETSATFVKKSFATLMEGGVNVFAKEQQGLNISKVIGIPLTSEILSEIICFGCENLDLNIQKNAETVLTLIIKSRPLLEKYWCKLLEILIPNFPLLQCLASKSKDLSSIVLQLLDSDDDIPHNFVVEGNLRFLFAEDSSIRNEALSKIVCLVSEHPDSQHMVPNVLQITDTLYNNICVLDSIRDPDKIFAGGLYERSTVNALIELLKSDNVEPQTRKTSLVQLNVICQDPELNKLVHDADGWYLAVQALQNSLKINPSIDYPESARPAVGILTKIALYNSKFRYEFSKEVDIYYLLIRALFIFSHDIAFRQDCVLALFLFLFSQYLIGNQHLTVPKILTNIRIPIKCGFHWNASPYQSKSPIESLYLQLLQKANGQKERESITNRNNRENVLSTRTFDSDFDVDYSPEDNSIFIDPELAMQFVRMSYANLWFGSLNYIIVELKKTSNIDDRIDYEKLPGDFYSQEGNAVIIHEPLNFNKKLMLKPGDIQLIRTSGLSENLRILANTIQNATNHQDVLSGINGIATLILLETNESVAFSKAFNELKRFIITPPVSDLDKILFQKALKLLAKLVEAGDEQLLERFLKELKTKHCIFLLLLKNAHLPVGLYETNCDFLRKLLIKHQKSKTDFPDEKKSIDKNYLSFGVYDTIFEICISMISEYLEKHDIDRMRCLLDLLHIVTASDRMNLDSNFINESIKKLLSLSMKLKCFSQAGSYITKICLMSVANLSYNLEEFNIQAKQLRFLSGLCGHIDPEIRGLSWCVHSKIAQSTSGAQFLIKELSFLPGGFHACCLSTFLDNREVPFVRAAAGEVLYNLLSHLNTGKTVSNNISLAPLCVESDLSLTENAADLVKNIFVKHRFFEKIREELEKFYIADIVTNSTCSQITTCEVVRSYCSILITITDLKMDFSDKYNENPFIMQLLNILKLIPVCITNASLQMGAQICNLISKLLQGSSMLLQRTILQSHESVSALIYLLDLKLYENRTKTPIISMLQFLRLIASDSMGLQQICESCIKSKIDNLITTILYGISFNGGADMFMVCSDFLTTMLLKSQSEDFSFDSFNVILDRTILKDNKNAAELIFSSSKIMYDRMFLKDKTKYVYSTLHRKTTLCEVLAISLKTLPKARALANSIDFLALIIERLNCISKEIGVNCSEYLRKFGEAKASPIIDELSIIFGVIANWFSSDCLVKDESILELTRIFIKYWPWINHSADMQRNFLNCLMFLSEHSIPVCKQFSSSIIGYSNTLLQLVINLAVDETFKVKSPQSNVTPLNTVIRIAMNCCSCIEGRMQYVKVNILDVVNRFQPFVTKSKKSCISTIQLWLQFWENFSRYPEGNSVRHLYFLCSTIAKCDKELRLLCISILRNMSFSNQNRAALLSSEDFIYTIKTVLDGNDNDEQFLVLTTIWRLVSGNHKAKHIIKSSSIPKKLENLAKLIAEDSEENSDSDIMNCLRIILNIINI